MGIAAGHLLHGSRLQCEVTKFDQPCCLTQLQNL